MAIAHSVSAAYEDGWLKPLEPLPLRDRQRVEITVTLPEESQYNADPERVRQLHEKAEEWLAQQPAAAVQEPRELSPDEQAQLDADFDRLIAEIWAASGAHDEADLAPLVDEAASAAQKPHG